MLSDGELEHLITPLRDNQVDSTCCFYIASVVIEPEWGGLLPTLLKRAVTFYNRAYGTKTWTRVCAIGYSPQGQTLLEKRGAERVYTDNNREFPMFTVDRNRLGRLSRTNRAFWLKLLPPVTVSAP